MSARILFHISSTKFLISFKFDFDDMMKNITALFSLIFCLASLESNAQNFNLENRNTLSFSQNKVKDQLKQNEGPYVVNFKQEIPYIASNAALFGIGLLMLETNKADPFTLDELNMLDRNDINGFDRAAAFNNSSSARSASDVLFNVSFALPSMVFLINKKTRKDVLSLFVMGAESFFIVGGLNLNAKHIFNRARPYTYNPAFSLETRTNSSSRLSFFSGHTSQTAAASFFIAKVISDYHPNLKKGVRLAMWTTAIAIPASTGYLRVKSGRHFNSDVIVGFSIGAVVGWLVPHLHRKERTSKISFKPFRYNGANGFSFVLKLDK